MTNADYTDITVILDRSGSMQQIKTDTEGGFNAFVADQQAQPGECRLTLTQFDDEYEVVYSGTPIADVPGLALKPRGRTALLDAIGRTVTATGERLAALDEADRPGHVIIVIITDGYENASREWNRDRVFAEVTKQTDEFGWVFTYLGANQDAINVAGALGVSAQTSMNFNTASTVNMYASASAAVTRTRNGQRFGYTDAERAAAIKK